MGDGNDRFTSSADLPAAMPLAVDGGPGDDRLSGGSTSMPVTFTGGDGNDSLTGGPGADTLDGGAGNDDVDGAGGPDTVLGGAGDDILHGDHFENPAPDVIDGGPGTDVLQDDYASRFTDQHPDVSITLGTGADDGRPGEGDDLRNVEQVIVSGGGQLIGTDGPELLKAPSTSVDPVTLDGKGGNDTLDGGGGDDTITGGPGDDAINAGYGNDTIVGGPGRDVIHADLTSGGCGPVWCDLPYGNDTINVRDGEVDTVDCGFGTDSVIADPQDMIARRTARTSTAGRRRPAAPAVQRRRARAAPPGAPPVRRPRRRTLSRRARRRTLSRASRWSAGRGWARCISRGLLVRVAGRSGRVTVTAHDCASRRGAGHGDQPGWRPPHPSGGQAAAPRPQGHDRPLCGRRADGDQALPLRRPTQPVREPVGSRAQWLRRGRVSSSAGALRLRSKGAVVTARFTVGRGGWRWATSSCTARDRSGVTS